MTKKLKSGKISCQLNLMNRILEVRYTDIEEEKHLCKKLLELSEGEQYFYGTAFANVYLVDSHLALGEYNKCDFYLLRARFLCKEYGFDDLMLVLCNCAGVLYQKLNDDAMALQYFLDGGEIAEKQSNKTMASKLYNNIGYSFAKNGDFKTARIYIQQAYDTIADSLEGENIRIAFSYLKNLSEACIYLEDTEGCRTALLRCKELAIEDNLDMSIRLECSWCSYYTAIGDIESSVAIVDRLMESDLLAVEEHIFIFAIVETLCENMLKIKDEARARRLLDILEKIEYHTALFLHHSILCLKIKCWEAFGEEKDLFLAYQEYYEVVMKMSEIENETRLQSMFSKIQINQAIAEREAMQLKRQELEDASRLDELTGLYNRRYFNNLLSKIIQRSDIKTLGFVMLDVDYFKQYNDFYGHFKGDDALRTVARVLSENIREGIHVSRYGGDEFVCLCINLSEEEVKQYTKDVIEALKRENVPHEKHVSSDILTVSMGYCNEVYNKNMEYETLLNMADKALYSVKKTNRGGAASYKEQCK